MMRKLLLSLVTMLLVCLMSILFTANIASAHTTSTTTAHTVRPNCSGNYWQTDSETLTTSNGYRWDVALLSFRQCGSGTYQGKMSDHDCVTSPGNPTSFVRFWNYGYQDGVPVAHNSQAFSPMSPNTTYCLYTGSFYVTAGHGASACGWLQNLGLTYESGPVCAQDAVVR